MPRNDPTIGDNRPDPRPGIVSRLTTDYLDLASLVAEQETRAGDMPNSISTPEDHDAIVNLIGEMNATAKRIEAVRVDEKAPYLMSERAVDGFFQPLSERIGTARTDLSRVIKKYLDKKAADERRRRQEEADRQQRIADAAAAEARKREEAAAAAKRKDHREQHSSKATEAHELAEDATARALTAQANADMKPSALSRTRTDQGGLSTLKMVWKFAITDLKAIPLDELRPFIKREEIERAIRQYVGNGGRELAGVNIYEDTDVVVR